MSLPVPSPRVGAVLLAGALTTALALPALAHAGDAPSGNNGTLKVHGPNTPFDDNRNEPQQVCRFYLAGFGFDPNQVVNYRFTLPPGGPNGGEPRGNPGSFTVGPDNGNPAGDGRTPVLKPEDHGLENGRYRVTGTTTDGSKTKVFRVSCDEAPGGNGGNGGGDDDEVGGVGNPADEDGGAPAVGGVATGGGGTA